MVSQKAHIVFASHFDVSTDFLHYFFYLLPFDHSILYCLYVSLLMLYTTAVQTVFHIVSRSFSVSDPRALFGVL